LKAFTDKKVSAFYVLKEEKEIAKRLQNALEIK